MLVTLSGIVTFLNLLQPRKAERPMLVTLSEITAFVIAEYDDGKTEIIVEPQTHWGKTTSLIPLQPSNVEYPILVTLSGIVMLVRPLQPLNALLAMLVTLFGIVTLVSPLQL